MGNFSRRFLVSMMACFLMAAAPTPSVTDKLAVCATIEIPLGRLQCYDAVVGRPSQEETGDPASTEWEVTDDIAELDRSRRIILSRVSKNTGEKAVLALRCMEKKTSIVVGTSDYLGSETSTIRYRIGDMEPVTDRWNLGGDGRVVFGPMGNSAISLIKHMANSKEFVIRITKYGGEQVQYVFDLDGLAEHVSLLAEVCGWPAPIKSATE